LLLRGRRRQCPGDGNSSQRAQQSELRAAELSQLAAVPIRERPSMKESRRSRRHAFLCAAVVVAALWSLTAAAQSNSSGWSKAGNRPADYDMGLDRNNAFTGTSSGYIKSNKPSPQGFGTYMQMFDAMEYRGKRLRFSAYVRSENVEDWAGLWMR